MTLAAPLAGASHIDAQIVKQWAAEDFAIAMGLLRECPYHGQPFKTRRKGLVTKAVAAGLIDPLDPNVQVFNGDTQELLAAVERVTGDYGERCELCAASDEEEFD
jgi:hypothetical protein